MTRIILRKVLQIIIVLFFVSLIVFFTFRLLPGDAAQLRLGLNPSEEAVIELRQQMGLDKPLVLQYFDWITNVLKGDFGRSSLDGTPVSELIINAFPKTLELALFGILLSLTIAIIAGVIATIYKGSWWDRFARIFSLVGFSTPDYWLAILLMLLFSYKLGILPAGGYIPFWEAPWQHIQYLILPVITIGIINAAQMFRFLRSGMLEVIDQDYIRTARAKGISGRLVIGKHVARNAVPNLITVLGLNFSLLLSGMVVTEQIFAWPGIGWLLIQSILSRDYDVVQGAVLISATIIVLINLLTDVINVLLDPRIKYD